jgi:diguanylate cyclase (GGDEF)-like protein/PAS domain S-box-containing protein
MEFAAAFRYSDSIVAVMRVDDGALVDVNPAFERKLGWSRTEALGKLTVELGLWPDQEIRARIWALLRTERHLCAESVTFLARDGRPHRGRLTCELFEHDGHTLVLCVLQSIEASDSPPRGAGDPAESYRALFLAAAEGIYRCLPDGGFIDVNPALARIFGFDSPAHMLTTLRGPANQLYVDPGHAQRVRAELASKGRIEQWRAEVRRRDGSTIWVSENERVVLDEAGHVMFYEGTVVDITERLAGEAALRQSEALYKALVDNCRDGVFLIQRGRVRFANRAMASILGYADDELHGVEYMTLIAPEDRAAQGQRRAERESGSFAPQAYEITLLRKDGSRVLCAVRADAVVYNGDIASTGVLRDVTDERRQQRALEQAERKFRELFQHSPVGLYRTHPDGSVLEANARLSDMLGYDSPEDLVRSIRSMLDVYVDPGDRPRVLERLRREGEVTDLQTRIRCKDGRPIWVELSARVHRSDDGKEMYFEGSVQEITGRIEAQRAVERSEAKYRTLVDHAQVGVFIMLGDRYTYVNHALAAMLGMTEEELTGRNWREITAPEFVEPSEWRDAQRAAGRPVASDFETCLVGRDGGRVYVTISIGPLDLDGVRHMTGTVRDITRHRQAEQRLRFQATHDPLTGLPNRLILQQRLDDAIKRSRTSGRYDYAVLFLDLDGFKLVNDSLGHGAGDRLLVAIAERLGETLKDQAMVARYGGDEFTILPLGPCEAPRAHAVAERVLELFELSFEIGGHRVFSGASVGIVLGRAEYRSPDQVLRDADTAMYEAKAGGKGGYVVFDETMHRAARARFQLETDLRLALLRREFCVYYQPIVRLADRRIVGCEALVRWNHPERGLLVPGHFLQVAEEAGMVTELDWWVLEEACHQASRWQRSCPAYEQLRINVNVDERQLSDPNMVAEVQAILESCGLPAASVGLEVTETVFRSQHGRVIETLGALKALGLNLVVDDFGTGYSSLDSFASSPFDALKVDRSFVHDVESNRRHRAIVRTITAFAEDLGLELVAEGVETEGQAKLLAEMGCVTGQGYLYAMPMPAADLEALLGGAPAWAEAHAGAQNAGTG